MSAGQSFAPRVISGGVTVTLQSDAGFWKRGTNLMSAGASVIVFCTSKPVAEWAIGVLHPLAR